MPILRKRFFSILSSLNFVQFINKVKFSLYFPKKKETLKGQFDPELFDDFPQPPG